MRCCKRTRIQNDKGYQRLLFGFTECWGFTVVRCPSPASSVRGLFGDLVLWAFSRPFRSKHKHTHTHTPRVLAKARLLIGWTGHVELPDHTRVAKAQPILAKPCGVKSSVRSPGSESTRVRPAGGFEGAGRRCPYKAKHTGRTLYELKLRLQVARLKQTNDEQF